MPGAADAAEAHQGGDTPPALGQNCQLSGAQLLPDLVDTELVDLLQQVKIRSGAAFLGPLLGNGAEGLEIEIERFRSRRAVPPAAK